MRYFFGLRTGALENTVINKYYVTNNNRVVSRGSRSSRMNRLGIKIQSIQSQNAPNQ